MSGQYPYQHGGNDYYNQPSYGYGQQPPQQPPMNGYYGAQQQPNSYAPPSSGYANYQQPQQYPQQSTAPPSYSTDYYGASGASYAQQQSGYPQHQQQGQGYYGTPPQQQPAYGNYPQHAPAQQPNAYAAPSSYSNGYSASSSYSASSYSQQQQQQYPAYNNAYSAPPPAAAASSTPPPAAAYSAPTHQQPQQPSTGYSSSYSSSTSYTSSVSPTPPHTQTPPPQQPQKQPAPLSNSSSYSSSPSTTTQPYAAAAPTVSTPPPQQPKVAPQRPATVAPPSTSNNSNISSPSLSSSQGASASPPKRPSTGPPTSAPSGAAPSSSAPIPSLNIRNSQQATTTNTTPALGEVTATTEPESPRGRANLVRADSKDEAERKRLLAKRNRTEFQRKQTTRVLQAADPDRELRAAFDALDRDRNGLLTPEETQLGLSTIGMDLPRDLIVRLVQKISPNATTTNMDFAKFKQFFDFLVPLKELFAKHDKDGSGSVDRHELTALLREMKWDFDPRALEQLIQMITSSSAASPSRGSTASASEDEELDFQQFASLVIYLRDLAAAFKTQDADKSNSLNVAELQALLRVLGIYLSVLETDLHLKRVNSAGNAISFETLIALLQSIRVNGEAVKKQATTMRTETRRNLVVKPSGPIPTPTPTPTLTPLAPPTTRPSLRRAIPSVRTLERKVTKLSIADAASKNKEAQKIIESLRATPGRKWEDLDFPASAKSLYSDPAKVGPIKSWRRTSELSSSPKLFVDTIDEGDVVQGALGDCWFLSALSVLATSPDELVKNIFVGSYPEYGFYQCTIYKDGEWRIVTVDDRIPCGASGKPYFASCRDENEFWVPILEKAYAKLHGSYAAIESGNICDGLVDLTGECSEAMDIVPSDDFWKSLVHAQEEGYLMGCSSAHANRGVEEESPLGILQNHAYGVMEVREYKGNRLLRIRNPWGSHEWKGCWSDGAKEWTPELQKALNAVFGDDGSFFMCFDDFVQQFNRLYVLRLLSDDIGIRWQKQTFPGEWTQQTAGGCSNFPTWSSNPQYKILNETKQATRVFLSVRQPDIRMRWVPGAKYPALGIMVLKDKGNDDFRKIKQSTDENVVTTPFYTGREASVEFVAEPGTKYVVIPCTFAPQVISKYTFTVYSIAKVSVTSLTTEPPMAAVKGSWSKALRTAGGCTNHGTWRENPQYLLRIQQKSHVSIVLEQPNSTTKGPVAAGFYLFKSDLLSNRKKLEVKEEISKPIFMDSPHISADFDLDPGQYNILPCTFDSGVEADFVLRAVGPATISLRPVEEQWKEKQINGSWGPGLDGAAKAPMSRDKNPKHKFTLSTPSTVYVFISVQKQPRPAIGYLLYKQNALVGNITFSNGGSPGQSWKLDSGVEYTIVPATFDGGLHIPYCISMYSDANITQL